MIESYYRNYDISIEKYLKNFFSIEQEKLIICVGTDRIIIDCLGPLIGTKLKERNIDIKVFGTLNDPIHAINIEEQIKKIKQQYPNHSILAIDAAVGEFEKIGYIRIKDCGVFPGKGTGKDIEEIGDISIIGIIEHSELVDNFGINNVSIRLSFVDNIANKIIQYIENALIQVEDEIYA